MPRKMKDLTGARFGMLQAVSPSHTDGQKWWWVYECDCGKTCIKLGQDVTKDLRRGRTSNCGCMTGELIARGQRTHGASKHPAYAVWRSMCDRCRLPSHQAWQNYGGRGIRVCARWRESFSNFWEDMGPGYARGLEIDRVENNADYEPANCRWVPRVVNANNRRGNQTIETPDGPQTISQASRSYGIRFTTLLYRIRNGWPQNRLFIPANFHNRESLAAGTLVSVTKRSGKIKVDTRVT